MLVIYTNLKMPLRRKYGYKKKKRYGRKLRRGRKMRKYRKRRGYRKGRKMSKYTANIVKTGTKYTTIYKTGVRVTSKAGTCSFYCLAPDPDQVQWTAVGTRPPFAGDMTFGGPIDIAEVVKGVRNEQMNRIQGTVGTDATLYNVGIDTVNTLGVRTENLRAGPSADFNYAYGKFNYQLQIKSAITGANIFVTLYKCVARYDLPALSEREYNRTGIQSSVITGLASWSSSTETGMSNLSQAGLVISPVGAHAAGWWLAFKGDDEPIPATGAQLWTNHQEGTSLYDNKLWCSLFKIKKSYNIELVPGQMAKLSLKQKRIKALNTIQHVSNLSYSTKKGMVCFVLKIQGALGHEKYETPDQTQKYRGGAQSRPAIGLMPAAADVLCFKKLNAWCNYKPAPKIRNVTWVQDYYDDQTTENMNYDTFVDAAPSDYANAPAVIG